MATTAYTIYSHYDPADREVLERETGQLSEDYDPEDAWKAEAIKAFKRKQPPPPRFVPASSNSSISLDDWSSSPGAGPSKPLSSQSTGVSGWYRSMISSAQEKDMDTKPPTTMAPPPPQAPVPDSAPKPQKPTKNDWFIQKVLTADAPTSAPSTPTPPPSLADMLARNPLPSPNDKNRFIPPVFLAIGPSNKGFSMLQNSGWNEGEALGQDVVRRRRITRDHPSPWVKEEDMEVKLGDGEITEVRKVEVVDLTVSDSDSDSEDEPVVEDKNVNVPQNGRKALLTPLPTVLKSDRLGIGLKAKTEGPYKASVKRVTHNAAALAAHYRRAEEARLRKEKWGKGRRGFARRDKEEQTRRQNMLTYMNS
ncbi:hypothetical protein GYMLUDRAFT_46578 [Collybiopsis luxurians FD-317 M1]|uniref:Unplaced genomic scaffold GYMLUscaffold_44, whole genome shotgun sequence n=1 Tax=Collybiopsis luxurians FD-317 M1 TaxID=944289 RepID=A0A0D0B2B2_9AGAR|nr:hypothetical protein GYMLUDRAFT_46578 [Collybiopsis luxurians FD-317 M1]